MVGLLAGFGQGNADVISLTGAMSGDQTTAKQCGLFDNSHLASLGAPSAANGSYYHVRALLSFVSGPVCEPPTGFLLQLERKSYLTRRKYSSADAGGPEAKLGLPETAKARAIG